MEYALYSLSSISRVGRLLHHEDEEYNAKSIVRRRGGVHRQLLLSTSQLSTRPTPRPPAHDGGRRVGRLLHHKEKRGVGCVLDHVPPLLLVMEEAAYSSLSSILQAGCLLYREDEEYSVYSHCKEERRRGGVHCLLLLSSSPQYAAYSLTPHLLRWRRHPNCKIEDKEE